MKFGNARAYWRYLVLFVTKYCFYSAGLSIKNVYVHKRTSERKEQTTILRGGTEENRAKETDRR